MGSVQKAIDAIASSLIDNVVGFVKKVWDEIAMPILEFVFGLFGINDETVIQVQKISTAIYSSNTENVVAKAKARAVIGFITTDTAFLSNYVREMYATKAQVAGFYKYAEKGKYIHGLPYMEIRGGSIDYGAIDSAINTELGGTFTVLSVNTTFPKGLLYYKHNLQNDPIYNYVPNTNTLTYTDPYGTVRFDYVLTSVVFNSSTADYTINVSRTAEEALFWIEGPLKVTEGKSVTYTVHSNRIVPNGKQVTINFSYLGSAVNAVDYTQIASVVMAGNTDSVKLVINTIDNVIADTARDIVVTIDSITNTNSAFEAVGVHTLYSVTTDILDDDTLVLTLDSVYVDEVDVNVIVPVTLELDAPIYLHTTDIFNTAVDYTTTDTQLTLSTIPYDDSLVYIEFDGVEEINWTRVDGIVTFSGAIGATAQVVVKISSRSFTVDYDFNDITTLGGVDYDNTSGTLNFIGYADEIVNITVPLTADIPNGDREQFEIFLTNCSEVSIDITRKSVVTIADSINTLPVANYVNITDSFTKPNFVATRTLVTTYHDNNNTAAEWYFWLYELNSNIYTNISPKTSIITGMEMLPISILRRNKINIDVDKSTEEYKTTKRLMNYLNLDVDEFISNLENNRDKDKVTDAYVSIAMNPKDTNSIISKMLWVSFNEIIIVNGLTSGTNEYTATFSEQDINNAIVWSDQTFSLSVVGNIGPVDTYTHTIGQIITQKIDENYTGTTVDVIQQTLTLRFQVGSNTYNEIVLTGLSSMSAIKYSGYHNICVSDLGYDNFTIPVSLFVFNSLTPEEQLEVYQYLLRFDVFALSKTDIVWYKTSAFAALFNFVALVITIVSMDFSGGVYAILEELIINYLISELVVFVALKTGNAEFAAVVGLVASFALSKNGNKMFEFTSAESLVNLGTKFADNLTKGYDSQMQKLGEDMKDLNELAEQKLDEIDKLSKESEGDKLIDADFLIAINSVDTTSFPAINAQYEFDEIYNYDKLVGNFHDTLLTKGVI